MGGVLFREDLIAEWWFARTDFDVATVVSDGPVGEDVTDGVDGD